MVRILFIGSSTLDVFADARESELIDIRHPKFDEKLFCIAYGSKTNLEDVDLAVGGSAANSAATSQSLGAKAQLLSAVGGDGIGQIILSELRKEKMPTRLVKKFKDQRSAVGINIIALGGEKSILVFRGATDRLAPKHLADADVKNSDAVFIASLTSLENYALFERAIALAASHSKKVVFAPSISMIRKRAEQLRSLDYKFEIAIMNYEEASLLTGEKELKKILTELARKAKVAVVTMDKKGAVAFDGHHTYEVGAVPVQIKSTTGAGDAFSGAFATEYLKGASTEKALKAATAVAAMKLGQVHAAFRHSRKEVDAFAYRNAKHLKVKTR